MKGSSTRLTIGWETDLYLTYEESDRASEFAKCFYLRLYKREYPVEIAKRYTETHPCSELDLAAIYMKKEEQQGYANAVHSWQLPIEDVTVPSHTGKVELNVDEIFNEPGNYFFIITGPLKIHPHWAPFTILSSPGNQNVFLFIFPHFVLIFLFYFRIFPFPLVAFFPYSQFPRCSKASNYSVQRHNRVPEPP